MSRHRHLTAWPDFSDLGLGGTHVDYREAWELQRRLHAEVAEGSRADTVLLLEHISVYTAGKRTEPYERPLDGTPVIDVDRGGKITWHGPGQLVGYPIVRLPEPIGVVDYVRRLEEAMIKTFDTYGLLTGRVRGRSGVWLPADHRPGKIAAIGVRVAAGVTMHGFAINVDRTSVGSTRSFPAESPMPGSPRWQPSWAIRAVGRGGQRLRPELERFLAFEPYEQSPDLPLPPARARIDGHSGYVRPLAGTLEHHANTSSTARVSQLIS